VGRGRPFGVEDVADPLESLPGGVELEDSPDERGLVLMDYDRVDVATIGSLFQDLPYVAERFSSRSTAPRGLALEAAPRGLGDAHSLLLADWCL